MTNCPSTLDFKVLGLLGRFDQGAPYVQTLSFVAVRRFQEFHATQLATLESMRHYCVWSPKFHQWLHESRPWGLKL